MNTIDSEFDHDDAAHPEPHPDDAAEALASIEHELEEVGPERYVRLNLDVPLAIRIALGSLDYLQSARIRIAELPGIAIGKIDKLGLYGRAAWWANGLALPPTSPESPTQPLLGEAVPLRQRLLDGADALATFGYFSVETVAEIKAGKGFLDTANDCGALAALFRAQWDRIEGKTPITREEVDRAAVVGWKLVVALGGGGASPGSSKAVERKVRAFTLFVEAYEEARRAVSYLRWYDGDADTILPTLYPKQRRRASNGRAGDGESAITPPEQGTEPAEPS